MGPNSKRDRAICIVLAGPPPARRRCCVGPGLLHVRVAQSYRRSYENGNSKDRASGSAVPCITVAKFMINVQSRIVYCSRMSENRVVGRKGALSSLHWPVPRSLGPLLPEVNVGRSSLFRRARRRFLRHHVKFSPARPYPSRPYPSAPSGCGGRLPSAVSW
jgi:hypothetical protein